MGEKPREKKDIEREDLEMLHEKYSKVYSSAAKATEDFLKPLKLDSAKMMDKADVFLRQYLKGEIKPLEHGASSIMTEEAITERQARFIAWVIFLDSQKKLQWSLIGLSESELQCLFDLGIYGKKTETEFYALEHSQSDPEKIYSYMIDNDLIKKTHKETIYALINWFRYRAIHENGDDANNPEIQMKRYGHSGSPTTTELINQNKPKNDKTIFINGCHGTVALLKDMLSVIGVPARYIYTDDGHGRIEFPSIGKTVYHGDDLHVYKRSKSEAEIPAEEILVDTEKIEPYGESDTEEAAERELELLEKYMPDDFLLKYALYPYKYNFNDRVRKFPDLAERRDLLIQKVKKKLNEIGGGDLKTAVKVLKERIIISNQEEYY